MEAAPCEDWNWKRGPGIMALGENHGKTKNKLDGDGRSYKIYKVWMI